MDFVPERQILLTNSVKFVIPVSEHYYTISALRSFGVHLPTFPLTLNVKAFTILTKKVLIETVKPIILQI